MKLVVQRGTTMPFSLLPSNSIALDGFCQGPAIDLERNRFSFDHHDGCIRLVTNSTCKQVYDALLLGLDLTDMSIFINDVDGDTALAFYLLELAQHSPTTLMSFTVRELVEVVNLLDSHGPAYPLTPTQDRIARQFYEVAMQPEKDARFNKTYETCNLQDLLYTCLGRIKDLIDGNLPYADAEEAPTYEMIYQGKGWVIAKSDAFIFGELYKDGHNAAVAYRELPDGSYQYTIGKRSEFVKFPVGPVSKEGTILHMLAAKEAGWGGGSTIGGGPRNPDGSSSQITPIMLGVFIGRLLEGI